MNIRVLSLAGACKNLPLSKFPVSVANLIMREKTDESHL